MSTEFTINFKKLNKKYSNPILKGIELKYNEIYPNDTFQIEYKKVSKEYVFLVYKNMNIISENGIIIKSVLLEQYNNIIAIELFSSIPMENYLEEYDDSRKDYFDELKEYINGIEVCYKLLNFNFDSITYERTKYVISIKRSPDIYYSSNSVVCGYFKYNIITREEFVKNKRHIKNEIEKLYQKSKK